MEVLSSYKLPTLTVTEVKPLLQNERVISNSVNAITENGNILHFYENSGIALTDYVGQKLECLLEVVRGRFIYSTNNIKSPKRCTCFTYQWLKRPYELFPELLDMKNRLPPEGSTEDEADAEFDKNASRFFQDWGLNGIHIGIYQAKPLITSEDGAFFLNEFQFEDDIDSLKMT
jgi:hypothetical protein